MLKKVGTICALVVGALVAASSLSWGQNPTDRFHASKDACLSASTRAYYTPLYLSTHGKNPADGVKIVVAPLESDACVNLHVVGRYAWVWQAAGTKYRWKVGADGALSLLSRDDCGNAAKEIAYPAAVPIPMVYERPIVAPRTIPVPVMPPQAMPGGKSHKLRNTLVGLGGAAIVGGITYALTRPKAAKGGPPSVTTEGAKCVANTLPNRCPGAPGVATRFSFSR